MSTNLTVPRPAPTPQTSPTSIYANGKQRGAVPIINGRINGHLLFQIERAFQYAPPEIIRQWRRRGWPKEALETGVALHGLAKMVEALEAEEPGACPFCEVEPVYGRVEGRESYLADYRVTKPCGLHKGEFK